MGSDSFFSGPAARKFLLELMGDAQALNDTSGDLVADLRNLVELEEFLKIVENILPALEAAVPDVVGGIGVTADEFSEDELKRIIAFATGIQDAVTPYSDRRDARVDDLIFERAKTLLFVQAIGKRLPVHTVDGESIGMLLFRGAGIAAWDASLERAMRLPEALRNWYLSVVNEMSHKMAIETLSIEGYWWSEIDSPEDLDGVRGHYLQD